MGDRSVSGADRRHRPSWKLAAPHAARTQGLVVSGFARQEHAAALFLEFEWKVPGSGRGAWLRALRAICPITNADGPDPTPAAIAFTHTGLERLGLGPEALASFAAPFSEGMTQVDRLRRLGDRRGEEWQKTVIEGGYQWSGNVAPAAEEPVARIPTPHTVHAMLILYDKTEEAVEDRVQAVKRAIEPHDVRIVRRLPLSLRLDEKGIGREHFGFADGLSQPVPFEDRAVVYGDGTPVAEDEWHGVPLGDILIGHANAYREIAPGPVVPRPRGYVASDDPLALGEEGAPAGFLNFGLDGSYMVVRELRQHVDKFWDSLDRGSARIRERDPEGSADITAEWLAEREVGRNLDGDLLCAGGGVLGKDEYDQPQNAFGFRESDPDGGGCPLGSHVRRANPRDSLAPTPEGAKGLLEAANNHRILRRGRKFGKDVVDPRVDDGEDRGLLFICLQAELTRQFEFVQQTWLFNQNFHTLFDETDPLVGPEGMMTIGQRPLRRRVAVQTFVQCAGGEYFFLPSLPALAHLAAL
jgi:Dyp-type peroxidase family